MFSMFKIDKKLVYNMPMNSFKSEKKSGNKNPREHIYKMHLEREIQKH